MNCGRRLMPKLSYWVYAIFALAVVQGCSVKLVADYDAQIAEEIIEVSKQVDRFYGELLETEYANRSYDNFKAQYIEIEVNIRALVIQNKARPLNEESIAIAETTLNKWLKYKNKHKENWQKYQQAGDAIKAEEIYKDVLANNHRKRFTRLFTAMSVAEVAKDTEAQTNTAGAEE